MKEKMSARHMSFIVVMAIGWVGILNTGWLFTSYYALAQDALSVSDAAMGILVSITEGMGIWGYLVSGPVADWLKPKRSMDIGTVLMIIGVVLLVIMPSGRMAFLSCIIMVSSGMVFYATAALNLVGIFGPAAAHGRALGYFYALQGLIMLVEGTIISKMIAAYSATFSLNVLLIFSCGQLVVGQIGLRFFEKDETFPKKLTKAEVLAKKDTKGKNTGGFTISMLKEVLSSPRVWLLLLVGACTNCTTILITYTQPLLQTQFGVSTETVTMISTWTNQATLLVLSVFTGVLVDKIGSATKVILISLGCLFVGCAMVLAVPWQAKFVFVVVAALCFIRAVNSICKPGRQSMIDECGLPTECRGTICGLLSVAMVIPGTFMGTAFGRILTQYNNSRGGYQVIYIVFLVIGLIGVGAIFMFQKLAKKAKGVK